MEAAAVASGPTPRALVSLQDIEPDGAGLLSLRHVWTRGSAQRGQAHRQTVPRPDCLSGEEACLWQSVQSCGTFTVFVAVDSPAVLKAVTVVLNVPCGGLSWNVF